MKLFFAAALPGEGINKLSGYRQDSNGKKQKFIKEGNDINYQQLAIMLVNGKIYAFNDDDYDNYESLKAAIYHHKFRGQ